MCLPPIIRQRFAEDIKSDVVEALVPRYFRQEAEKQGLIPVSPAAGHRSAHA